MGRTELLCADSNVQTERAMLYNIFFRIEKVSENDQEIPKSQTAYQPLFREEESQNIYSKKTSVRQHKQSNQHSSSS